MQQGVKQTKKRNSDVCSNFDNLNRDKVLKNLASPNGELAFKVALSDTNSSLLHGSNRFIHLWIHFHTPTQR